MIDTKALRQKILDMAIKGKLVPQDPNDEPASVLLERIRAEKQQLIKEGKIKKDKHDSVIFKGDDNRYYENLPTGWTTCGLSTIANIFNGNSINEQEKSKKYYGQTIGYNYIGTKDVNSNHTINYENGVKIPYETSFKIAHRNSSLLCIEGGSAGRKIGILEEDVCFGNKLCAFETYGINPVYLFYFLQCAEFTRIFNHNTQGIIGGVSINTIKKLPFLLPPIAEQTRIVNRIEELFAQIDIIDQNQADIDTLYEEFRKRTLTLAIQGKLVPQDPNDEPASMLLERIRAEKKAKLGKKFVDSYIYKGDDNCYYEHIAARAQDEPVEVPFDIPKGWFWSRIATISDSYIGLTYKPTDIVNDSGYIVLRSSNIKDGKIDLEDIVRVSCNIPDKLKVIKNDIVICARNGSKKLVGKSAIVDFDAPNLTFGAFMAICRTPLFAYVSKFLLTACFFEQLAAVSGTTTINQLTQASFNSFLIPIPPLAEQNRIVAKINEIFAML